MAKARKKKRKKSRRKRGGAGVLHWLAGIVMLAAVGGFGYGLFRFLVEGPYFEVREILVEGQVRAATEAVTACANVSPGENLLFLDKEEVRKDVEAHPWVRVARVVKRLPNTLLIEVEEREPAALVNNAHDGVLYGLDAEGYVLPPLSAEEVAKSEFPVVTGIAPALSFPGNLLEYPRQAPVSEVVNAVREEPALADNISEIHWDHGKGYMLYPYFGSQCLLVGKDRIRERVAMLGQTWAFLERNEIATRYVDVRFESQGAVFLAEDLTDAEWMALLEEERNTPERLASAVSDTHSSKGGD
jgi:cell division protein FtsQ